MNKAWVVARREFRAYFNSPVAYVVLGVYLIATSPERARFGDRVAHTRVVFAR